MFSASWRTNLRDAIFTARNSILFPMVELAFRSFLVSSRQDVANVVASSEREDETGITTPSTNASNRNNTFQGNIPNDDIRV